MAYAKRASTTTFAGPGGSSAYLDATNAATTAAATTSSMHDSQHNLTGERASVAPVSGIGENESTEEHFTVSETRILHYFVHVFYGFIGYPVQSK